jgi:hypothetical protein
VSQAILAVTSMRQSAEGRARIAGIRANLASSLDERRTVSELLSNLAAAAPPGAQLDSFSVDRAADGWRTVVFGRSRGATGAAAVSNATKMFHFLQRRSPKLKDLDFQVSSYVPRAATESGSSQLADELLFTVTFVAPVPPAK